MAQLYTQLKKVAPSRHAVLITGESGTGKSRLAEWIHTSSSRAQNPFVSVSCAALPRELLESELFGFEKGAFSGASHRKTGRVELADGGSLFLDEIGEMPLDLQPKLLTFLQDKSFYRLGGHQSHQVDVRLIAATNRDLGAMVRDRTFREDLFYRLNVFPLHLPPLRDRQDEIPALALNFLKTAVVELEGPKDVGLSIPALDVLLSYPWPGNIRELRNAMFRAATLVDHGGEIGPELIAPIAPPPLPWSVANLGDEISPLPTLAEAERTLVATALRRFAGNKSRTAAALGISLKSVYNKIRQHRIEFPPNA